MGTVPPRVALARPLPGAAATLITAIEAGSRGAIARAITALENGAAFAPELAADLADRVANRGEDRVAESTGRAHVVGITGPPGAGKSTLINALLGELLTRGQRVAVVAVDPSSPRTGGAVLGDRIRMGEFGADERVFIRSLASRGNAGGLSRTTGAVVDLLDVAGFATVIVETVGAGQSDVAIASLADTSIVVCPPGLGDSVQATKAGILEIADILVVSKGDLPTAGRTVHELKEMLGLRPRPEGWRVPVLPPPRPRATVSRQSPTRCAIMPLSPASRDALERVAAMPHPPPRPRNCAWLAWPSSTGSCGTRASSSWRAVRARQRCACASAHSTSTSTALAMAEPSSRSPIARSGLRAIRTACLPQRSMAT